MKDETLFLLKMHVQYELLRRWSQGMRTGHTAGTYYMKAVKWTFPGRQS